MHDFNPGILPNGLFWTMALPSRCYETWAGGTQARLHVEDLPLPDTLFFSNNVSVAAVVDIDLRWRAQGPFQSRGNGSSVGPDDPSAFSGHLADARCHGRARGRETGFSFRTSRMTSDAFFAELGSERNGAWL